MKSIQLDFECFAYFAYKKPEDVMSDENLQIIRESYAENVLAVVEKECTMCFSSTASLTEHAKWVHGGMKEMQAAYERNRDGYISADNSGKLAAAAHPCTFYNTMKNSPGSLETRVERTDTQGTNYRRLFPGHENDECKYNAGMFDTTSPAFKAAKAAARASSSLGGSTAAQRYWDAMEAIEDGNATLDDEVRVLTKQLVMENLKERNKGRWDAAFSNNLAALVAYKQEHGSFVNMRSNDKKLAQFCSDMRRARKNPDSTSAVCDESRIAALDALGFEWAPWDQSFQTQLDALVAYKQEHGSFAGMRSNDKTLSNFCVNMRQARRNPDSSYVLDESRIDALDAIGFDWNPRRSRAKKTPPLLDDSLPVTRSEFDDLEAMIQKARSDLSLLEKEISSSLSESQGKKRKLRSSDDDMILVDSADEARLSYEESVKRGLGLMRPMPTPLPKPNPPPEGFHIGPCFCGNTGCQDCYDYQEQFRSKENPRKMIGGLTDRRNAAIAVGVAVGVAVASSVGRGTRV